MASRLHAEPGCNGIGWWSHFGRWGLAEIERLFALWHGCGAGEFDRPELRRRLIPLQARLGRLWRRAQANRDRKTAGWCRDLTKRWPALWTLALVDGVVPTNNGAERALRPAVLWRKGSFGADSEAGGRFAERLLTVGLSVVSKDVGRWASQSRPVRRRYGKPPRHRFSIPV